MKTFSIEEQERIETVIKACKLCSVGMATENGIPYVLPMNFGYEDGVVYLHSAQEGRSIRTLEQNPRVCITFCPEPKLIHQHPDVACSYRMKGASVICEGSVVFEDDFDEKERILNCIMRHYVDKTFKYSVPAVKNVKIWKVAIESVSAREFGVMRPGSVSYKDSLAF